MCPAIPHPRGQVLFRETRRWLRAGLLIHDYLGSLPRRGAIFIRVLCNDSTRDFDSLSEGLIPSTRTNFSVSCKPEVLLAAPWSPKPEASVRTRTVLQDTFNRSFSLDSSVGRAVA